MNKRQRKKKHKRCFLGLSDEFNLIGMTKEELDNVFNEREKFRKKYGYRKKYRSKSRMKAFYIFPSKRQVEEIAKIFKLARGREYKPSLNDLYNDN